jgi:hypothetical protein
VTVTGAADLVKDGGTVTHLLVLSTNTTWSNETLSITLPSGYSAACVNGSSNTSFAFGADGLGNGNDTINCTVTYAASSTDAAAGVILGGQVIATLTDSTPAEVNITGCTLPDSPVYTGSAVSAAGVALSVNETKYLSGKSSLCGASGGVLHTDSANCLCPLDGMQKRRWQDVCLW